MNELWNDDELKKAIVAYFKMLKYEKEKTSYVKAEENRQLQLLLPKRNKKSIEYRWQNISAVLLEHEYDFVPGYKPAKHVGDSVKERIWQIIKEQKLI
jgi:5-methylcytosine-specific restriction enzyme A